MLSFYSYFYYSINKHFWSICTRPGLPCFGNRREVKDKGFYRLAGEISGLRTTLASCDKDYDRYPPVVGRQRARKNILLECNGS